VKHIDMTHVSNRKFGCMKGYEFHGDYNTSKVMLEYVICLCNVLKYIYPNLNQKEAKEANLHVLHLVKESFKGNKM
jgi:hypothetical protein